MKTVTMCLVYVILLMGAATSIEVSEKTNITSYNPAELLAKIFNSNETLTSRQRGYGLVFEDSDPQNDEDQGLITFEENNHRPLNEDRPLRFEYNPDSGRPVNPLRFEDEVVIGDQIAFQDDNRIDHSNKKKKRRRRKPKNGLNQRVPPNFQGGQNFQGFDGRPGIGFGSNPYPVNPGYGPNAGYLGPVPHKRRRRPRPSLASDALSAVTGALTSIALYDDLQCVPRLLCEAAGGGSLGSNGVLNSIAGIQPLLGLLSAYNGISASPLFVFGRAVFLGMTSQGNTGTCRYAYPQCPTDPEQLIHYLNNHNGGFFRFFNSPGANQGLEQFYDHLGQNGQFIGPDGQALAPNGQILGPDGQFIGPNGQHQGYDQGFNQNPQGYQQGGYGLYQNYPSGNQGFQNQFGQRPDSYGQNYGSNYDYNAYGSNNNRFKSTFDKLEKRIQNKPGQENGYVEDHSNLSSKLQFPEFNKSSDQLVFENDDDQDILRFPKQNQPDGSNNDSTRKGKSILFPENQYNQNAYSNKMYSDSRILNSYNKATSIPYYTQKYYNINDNIINNNINKQTTSSPFNGNDYYFDYKHNFYVKKNNNEVNDHNNNYKDQNKVLYNNNNNNNSQKPANYVNYNNYKDQNKVLYNSHYNNNSQKPANYGNYNNYKDQNKVSYNTNNYYNNGNGQIPSYLNYNNYENSGIKNDDIQTVYIVRGNGDPNKPEIVKVRPGEAVN